MNWLIAIGLGAAGWLLWRSNEPRGGKEWRGYQGTVSLKPGVVYRVELMAPATATIDRGLMEDALGSKNARNFLWNATNDGVHLYFDQSFPEGATLTFGKSGLPPFTALTARRVDGLAWDSA